MTEPAPPRVESLTVRNYRALRSVTLDRLTPLTALLGPNGSGKSTVFDVLAFLSECLSDGIRRAWDRRGRFLELRSRDSTGPIVIELKYRERSERTKSPLITYHLEINEERGRPVVSHEFLRWTRGGGSGGRPFNFLDYRLGAGEVVTGETPERDDTRIPRRLSGPDVLAVSTLGTLAENPRVIALRTFITDWHLSYLSADDTRGNPEAGAEERLSPTGDNLPNVIQYLREQHPDRLEQIFAAMRQRVPRIERVEAETLADSRLLLRIKDGPFSTPVLSRFASDGTLKLLAYLTILHDPAQADRHRGARELPAPAPAAGARRRVPAGGGARAAHRHHPLAVLHRRVAVRGGTRSLPRARRLYAGLPRLEDAGHPGVH